MFKSSASHLALLLAIGWLPTTYATSSSEQGYAVAKASDLSDAGFKDSRVKLQMVLRNSAGQEVSRNLILNTLEKESDDSGDKTLVVFSSPADVRNTALLNHPHIDNPDDQWLYLPAIKRVKRISTSNKSGPFVGSEFSFEDFTSQELNKYTYDYLRRDTLEGTTVDVIVRVPRDSSSGYSKQIVYVDISNSQPVKVEFFDRKQALLKTLALQGYRQTQGIWRSYHQQMVNHQTGKSTDLIMSNYEFGVGFKPADFDSSALKRLQ